MQHLSTCSADCKDKYGLSAAVDADLAVLLGLKLQRFADIYA